ncbi:MAG: hypothetical protein JWM14_2046 [Chitinophagaceae bacterium]|nr:hypothetical protein [Chitinophagaceae bacterium]
MNKFKSIIFIILLINLFACEPPVTFDEPQPSNTDNLSTFPKRLKGQYLSADGESTLIIDDKFITRIYDYDYRFHRKDIDTFSRISGDTIIDINTNEKAVVKFDGDTVINHIHYSDTTFILNYDNVVRKFKGCYFLNIRYDKESWIVQKLQLSHGKLTLSGISTKAEIDNLITITESPQDTIAPFKFKPTKKQFKKFLNNDGFVEGETFVRLEKKSW